MYNENGARELWYRQAFRWESCACLKRCSSRRGGSISEGGIIPTFPPKKAKEERVKTKIQTYTSKLELSHVRCSSASRSLLDPPCVPLHCALRIRSSIDVHIIKLYIHRQYTPSQLGQSVRQVHETKTKTKTDLDNKCRRSESKLSGASSFRNICSAASDRRDSRNSRYFCCRIRKWQICAPGNPRWRRED